MVRLLADRSDTKSNVKLGGFRSQLQASYVSSHMKSCDTTKQSGLVGRVFANGPGDLGSIIGRVIPKTFKIVLDISLLKTQQYKVCIRGKVEQSRERSSALPLHLGVVAIEKGTFLSPSTTVANNNNLYIYIYIMLFYMVSVFVSVLKSNTERQKT